MAKMVRSLIGVRTFVEHASVGNFKENMEEIILSFDGPFNFTNERSNIFTCKYRNCSGIYIWAVKNIVLEKYLIHYIGETEKFASRQREHLINILGLNYGIFEAGSLKQGVEVRLWDGLWRMKALDAPCDAIKKYDELRTSVLEYLTSIEVFFAETDVSSKERKNIEGHIGINLRNNHKEWSTIYPSDNHIGLSKISANKILKIECESDIAGLDSQILLRQGSLERNPEGLQMV